MKTSTDKSKASETVEELAPVRIEPHGLYRPAQLEAVLGVRCLNHLRAAGLRAISGWYFGEAVLVSLRQAWQTSSCQCVSARKEEQGDAEHTKKEMEKDSHRRKVHAASRSGRPNSLLRQMAEIAD